MVDFRAFRAWRPRPDVAAQVAAVPYDVVDTIEGRREAGPGRRAGARACTR